jgi:hypothetical protein
MSMNVVSKFRTDYWIRQFISFVGGLFIIGLCVYFSFDNGQLDYRNVLFWFAAIGTVGLVFFVVYFLVYELKKLAVKDNGIEIKYALTNKTEFILYTEIVGFTTRRITHSRGAGRTDGYHELEIQLTNDRVITFNEDQYGNYNELKNSIYRNRENNE